MEKLIWLLDWLAGEDTSRLPADERAWQRACARGVKLIACGLASAYVVWWLGGYLTLRLASPVETTALILRVGDATYKTSDPTSGMHASSTRYHSRDGARLLLPGESEPVLFFTFSGALREFAAGEHVRVTYRKAAFLFWREMSVTQVSKLEGTVSARAM